MKEWIVSYLDENKERINKTYKELHLIPEIAFSEIETANYLSRYLKEYGFSVKTRIGGTGVIGTLDSGNPGPCVGLRADMDALLHEVSGKQVTIHSCGHDANCTTVLSAAEVLAKSMFLHKGQLKIIFQPAEETLCGAKAIIGSGEMDGIDYLIGSHLRPMEELPYGKISPSVRHGASAILFAEVNGLDAHGARPHQGINAIDACCSIIFAVNSIHLDPRIPYSVKATMIKSGGSAFNVIPGKAEICFDLRAQTNEAMQKLKEILVNTIEKSAQSIGAYSKCWIKSEVPAAQDSDEVIKIAKDCIRYVIGDDGVSDYVVTTGGEDFHEYSKNNKNLKTTILGIGADLTPGLHKPDMTFKIDALLDASKVMALIAYEILK